MKPIEFYQTETIERDNDWFYHEELVNEFIDFYNFNCQKYKESEQLIQVDIKAEFKDLKYCGKYPITYAALSFDNEYFCIAVMSGKYGSIVLLYITNEKLFVDAKKYLKQFDNYDDNETNTICDLNDELEVLDGINGFFIKNDNNKLSLISNEYHLKTSNAEKYQLFFDEKKCETLKQELIMPLYRKLDFSNTKKDILMDQEMIQLWTSILEKSFIVDDYKIINKGMIDENVMGVPNMVYVWLAFKKDNNFRLVINRKIRDYWSSDTLCANNLYFSTITEEKYNSI
jgi:hypothetical protein